MLPPFFQVSVLSLNLAVCEVLSYFAVDTSGQLLPSWWFSDLVSYITQTLSETKLSNEQMSGTLRILEKLVGFNLDEGSVVVSYVNTGYLNVYFFDRFDDVLIEVKFYL